LSGGGPEDARIARGMKAQLDARRKRIESGERRVGWKIGLNAPAAQRQLGISKAMIGYLTSGTELAPGSSHSLAGATRVGVEAEIVVEVAEPVAAGVDRERAAAAIGGLGAAIEVIDIDLPFEDLERILAGNVFHRAVIMGAASSARADVDASEVVARVLRNGSEEATAPAGTLIGELPDIVRLVADMLGAFGETLLEGDRIISGSLTTIVWVEAGDRAEVDLGPLGKLAIGFTD
jgi:2-oxo-3-hexenedioate decarboxylase